MAIYTAKTAKRKSGRRRAAPVRPPFWLPTLAGLLVLIGALSGGAASILLSGTGASAAAIFLVLHFRHASYVVTAGAQKELEKR